jgi:hypothetical protein
VLVQVHFLQVPGGGAAPVGRPEVALAGWVHLLAFDLCVGPWIAQRADAIGWSRWPQAPLLGATFLVGLLGLLLFAAARWGAGPGRRAATGAGVAR